MSTDSPVAGKTVQRFEYENKHLSGFTPINDWRLKASDKRTLPDWYWSMIDLGLQYLPKRDYELPKPFIRGIREYEEIRTRAGSESEILRKGLVFKVSVGNSVLCITSRLLAPDFSTRLILFEEVMHSLFRPISNSDFSRIYPDQRSRLRGREFGGRGTLKWLPFNCHRLIYDIQVQLTSQELAKVEGGCWYSSAAFPQPPNTTDLKPCENLHAIAKRDCWNLTTVRNCKCDEAF